MNGKGECMKKGQLVLDSEGDRLNTTNSNPYLSAALPRHTVLGNKVRYVHR